MENIKKMIDKMDFLNDQEQTKMKSMFDLISLERTKKPIIFKDIYVEREPDTLYEGFHAHIPDKEKFLVVEGPTYSGKTTSFEKIFHFFVAYQKRKSPIKNSTPTKLSFSIKTSSENFRISYNSQKRDINEKLNMQEIDEKGQLKQTIDNPYQKLKTLGLLDNPFNLIYFIPQITDITHSFVRKFCAKLPDLRELYQNPQITSLIEYISNIKQRIENNKSNYENEIDGFVDEINKLEKSCQIRKKHIAKRNKYLPNKDKLISLRETVDNRYKEVLKKDMEKKKKIRSCRRKLKSIDSKISKLEDQKLNEYHNSIDKYVGSRPFLCRICHKFLPATTVKTRIKRKDCWNCGKMNKDYSEIFKDYYIPETSTKEINKKIDDSKKDQKELLAELKKLNLDNTSNSILDEISDIQRDDWKFINLFENIDELREEFSVMERKVAEDNRSIQESSEKMEEYKIKKENLTKKTDNLTQQIDELVGLINQLQTVEKEKFKEFKEKIIEYVNKFVIEISNDNSFGEILYIKKELCLKHLKKANNDHREDKAEETQIIEIFKGNELSEGQICMILYAFTFSFIKINIEINYSPLNLLFIDGIGLRLQEDIRRLIKKLNNFPIKHYCVFDSNIESYLEPDSFVKATLSRNERRMPPKKYASTLDNYKSV
ncbi:MAG: hypothetical protein GF364_15280 [Candidatus Lokiarchaeota archaeon]|nr:hypothetical protein [Candidatus Lokiarchaeota archaeon]